MAGLSEIVIEALRRIAKTDPDISSALGALQKRGIIDGISSTLGGEDGTGSDESCCSDNEAKEVEDPKDPWSEGEAPPEFTTTPDGVTDCATGQSVSFEPQGFPQAETCKECESDETWEFGYFWMTGLNDFESENPPTPEIPGAADFADASPATLYAKVPDSFYDASFYRICSKTGFEVISPNRCVIFYQCTNGSNDNKSIARQVCGSFGYTATCYTEPPEICGDNWQPDGSTAYTLRNGCIVASRCDTDAPSGDLGCNQCKTLCKDGVEWQVCATSDGGMVWTDPTSMANGGKYDGTGRRTEILNPGETGGYI